MPVTDIKKELEKNPTIKDVYIVKYITWNVKLNKGNEEVFVLFDLCNKTNLICQVYATQLPLKIWDTLLRLATINKQ